MSFLILVGGFSTFISSLLFFPPLPNVPGSPSMLTLLTNNSVPSNPSWLGVSPLNDSIVYATSENTNGSLSSFLLDKVTGELTLIDSILSLGDSPTHFALANDSCVPDELVAVNFGSGSVVRMGLEADLVHFVQGDGNETVLDLTGSGPNPEQTSSHPHEIVFLDDEILVPDLGADQIWRLNRSDTDGVLSIAGSVPQPAGSGPRRVVVLGGDLFTLHELTSTLTQHTLPALNSSDQPNLVASLSTLLNNTVAASSNSNSTPAAAELLLSPSTEPFPNQLLFVSNRHDTPDGDTIAIFSTSPLTLLSHTQTTLTNIRGLAFVDAAGQYLIAAGQDSGGVVVFARSGDQGEELNAIASLDESLFEQPAAFVAVPLM